MLSRRMPDFTLHSTMSIGKMLTAAEERAGCLAALQHSLNCAQTTLLCAKEDYEWESNKRIFMG